MSSISDTYDKLDPKVKARWVKELRSGKYAQRTGSLGYVANPDVAPENSSYCCLGVLAVHCGLKRKLKVEVGFGLRGIGEVLIPMSPTGGCGVNAAKIPDWARDIIGLDAEAMNELVILNDGGRGFNSIADWIEEKL